MAINYKLDLIIDDESLKILRASQLKVTLAKPVNKEDTPNVAWIVFDPFSGNTVEWSEEYGIYASPGQVIQNGAVITRMSERFPAQDAAYYSFDASATFSGPFTGSGAPMKGSFKAINNMPSSLYPVLTFGLEQKASINSKGIDPSPINAALVPASYNAVFTPLTTVYVWLQAEFTSGTVITSINGNSASVTFGGSTTSQTLKYDPNTGRFLPSTPSGQLISLDKAPHIMMLKREGVF